MMLLPIVQGGIDLRPLSSEAEVVIDDPNEYSREERLQQCSPREIGCVLVELTRVLEQVDVGIHFVSTMLETLSRAREPLTNCAFLERDHLKPLAQLGAVESASSSEIDQSFFLVLEAAKLLVERSLLFVISSLHICQSTLQEQLDPEVYELTPEVGLGSFPGYQKVLLRHYELQRILKNDEPSWRDALSSIKGVYVITDTSSGRVYVGSASGEADGLWQRWRSYAHPDKLTGGNKEFEQLRESFGDSHIVNSFQYSILEIFDPKTTSAPILERERFWKEAFQSRVHGMNWN